MNPEEHPHAPGRGGGILAPPEGGSKASKAAGTLWHPGRICPKPNGIKRENSEDGWVGKRIVLENGIEMGKLRATG